jgi:steroid delta-isomerase-like uncharacterized protein
MSVEQNKTLVRRYFEAAVEDPAIYDEILAADFQGYAIHHTTMTSDEVRGPEPFKAFAAALQAAWRERQMIIDELIAEGDRVMARWTFRGRHVGDAFGVSATGKEITYSGINIFRVATGKLAETWDIFDRLWIWQQMEILPPTGEFLEAARAIRR